MLLLFVVELVVVVDFGTNSLVVPGFHLLSPLPLLPPSIVETVAVCGDACIAVVALTLVSASLLDTLEAEVGAKGKFGGVCG